MADTTQKSNEDLSKSSEARSIAEKAIAELLRQQADDIKTITDYSQQLEKLNALALSKDKEKKKFAKDMVDELQKQFFTQERINKSYKRSMEYSKQIEDLTKTKGALDGKYQAALGKYNDKNRELTEKLHRINNDSYTFYDKTQELEEEKVKILQEINKETGLNLTSIEEIESIEATIAKTITEKTQLLEAEEAARNKISAGMKKMQRDELLSNVNMLAGTALLGKHAQGFKRINDIAKLNPYLAWLEIGKEVLQILLDQNKEVTDIQRNLMISGDEARIIRNEFVGMERSASGVGSAFETVKNMMEASSELSGAFGASIDFSGKNAYALVKNQIALTKELGLSGKEAGELQTTMTMVGMDEQTYGEMVTKSTLEARQRTGVTFNLKNIMAEIAKTSSATVLSLMRNPKALADAVVKAKELGTSIEKMNSIADGLLDIESSIGAQFEASVLTGKSLNFELAREKALRNDIAGATKDILQQIGGASEFTNMNRIQQEAIAKAVGMTRDELASSLTVQENYNKLSATARKDLLEGKTKEQRDAILMAAMDEKSAYAAAKKVDAQAKLNQMQEKLFSILTNLLAPLEPIVDVLIVALEVANFLLSPIIEGFRVMGVAIDYIRKGWNAFTDSIAPVMPVLKMVGNALAIILAIAASIAAAMAFASLSAIPFVGPILGAAAAIGAISLIYSAVSGEQLKDGVIAPDGGLMVSGAKGTYQLDKNDTVVAGTSLGKPTNTSNTNTVSGNSAQLDVVIQKLNQMIEAFNKKSFDVYLDGKLVSKNLEFARRSNRG